MLHADVPLPPPELRPGPRINRDDAAYLARADEDVDHLVNLVGLSEATRLLDWGCGPGRLAVAIVRRFGRIGLYHGIDVHEPSLAWPRRHLNRPGFEWTLVDAANARYNPDGKAPPSIPAASGSYDVLWAWSVLSHMDEQDVRDYAPEIARVLSPSGVAVVSAFVADGVPPFTENPAGYLGTRWSGPLHCVRFERSHITALLADAGLVVQEIQPFRPGGQSLVVAGLA